LRRHIEPARRYFSRRVACHADAEDLVQRTLLAALEALPRFREDVRFSGFVRAIARTLLLRYLRDGGRARGRFEVDAQPDALPAGGPSPLVDVAREDTRDRLRRAFRGLPEASMRLLRLRYWDERDVAEIARELDLSPAAVRTRLHRARQELKHALTMMASSDSGVWPTGEV
jgi:RNA polymerase sigma-70 factor (ECF subfamily)